MLCCQLNKRLLLFIILFDSFHVGFHGGQIFLLFLILFALVLNLESLSSLGPCICRLYVLVSITQDNALILPLFTLKEVLHIHIIILLIEAWDDILGLHLPKRLFLRHFLKDKFTVWAGVLTFLHIVRVG